MKLKKLIAIVSILALLLTTIGASTYAADSYSKWSGTVYGDSYKFTGTTYDEAVAYIAALPSIVKENITVDAPAKTITLKNADAFAFLTIIPDYMSVLNIIDCNDNGNSDPRLSAFWVGAEHHSWTINVTTSIDLEGQSWTPVESGYSYLVDFNDNTVKNVNVSNNDSNVGLFKGLYYGKNLIIDGAQISTTKADANAACLAAAMNGAVDNVTIKNATVNGTKYTGAIAGIGYGPCTNCKVIGSTLTSNSKEIGGLIGLQYGALIDKCEVTSTTITGEEEVAGLVGRVLNGDDKTHIVSNNTVTGCTLTATKNTTTPESLEEVGNSTVNYLGKFVGRIYNDNSTTMSNNTWVDNTTTSVAKIGAIEYDDFEDAVEEAKTDTSKVVELTNNVSNVEIAPESTFKLDTKGHSFGLKTGVLKKTDTEAQYQVKEDAKAEGTYVELNGSTYNQMDVTTYSSEAPKPNTVKITATKGSITEDITKDLSLPGFESVALILNYIITGIPEGVTVTTTLQ